MGGIARYEIRDKLYREYLTELSQYDPSIMKDKDNWGEWIRDYFFSSCDWRDVYSKDGQIIGFYIMGKPYVDCPINVGHFIEQVYIKKEYRNQGIMTELLEKYIKSHKGVYALLIINGNETAKSFWFNLVENVLHAEWTTDERYGDFSSETVTQYTFDYKG